MSEVKHASTPDESAEGEIVRAKGILDGSTTLAEAAQKAREFSDYLRDLFLDGWELDEEIADDYGFISKP